MYRQDFEASIDFDQILLFEVKETRYLYGFSHYECYHYFLNGAEVGYFIPCMDRGLVFETPRIWHESFKSHPSMRNLNYRKDHCGQQATDSSTIQKHDCH